MQLLRKTSTSLGLAALLLPVASSCRLDNDTAQLVGGGGGGGGGVGLTLTAADLPGVSPCPNQTILTDAGMFATFQTALANGTYLFRDVPFNGADPNIYSKKCGRGSFWNPANNVNEVAPFVTPVTLAYLFTTGNAGICAAGFNNASFGTGEGFPTNAVYRQELKVTHLGVTYLVRFRYTVTGPAAGQTFASRGITVPADLQNTLGYEVDGTPVVHDNLLPALVNALTVGNANVTLEAFDMAGGSTLVTATFQVLCVEIL